MPSNGSKSLTPRRLACHETWAHLRVCGNQSPVSLDVGMNSYWWAIDFHPFKLDMMFSDAGCLQPWYQMTPRNTVYDIIHDVPDSSSHTIYARVPCTQAANKPTLPAPSCHSRRGSLFTCFKISLTSLRPVIPKVFRGNKNGYMLMVAWWGNIGSQALGITGYFGD